MLEELQLHGLIGSGNNIKSIQRGLKALGAGTSVNVPISLVDLTKSIVKVSLRSNNYIGSGQEMLVRAKLTSASNLELVRDEANANYYPIVAWEVIEFNNVKSLQKGDHVQTSDNDEIAISSVNLNKSIIFNSYYSTITSGPPMAQEIITAHLYNETTIQLGIKNTAAANNFYSHWQVIEFN